ncbi:MAG: hypothetical protein AAGF92_19185 [Myxococcota bacterium]
MVRWLARWGVLAVLCASTSAGAQNSEDVVAGADVALTGGAVVANVHTGGAMWFNPAGVARLDATSVDLTGAVVRYSLIRAPGALALASGEGSAGKFSAIQAIPRALTFVASPRANLRWGVGFFFTRVTNRFVQDSVVSDEGQSPTVEAFGSADQTRSVYHVSSAVGWKKNDKLLFGGGLDIVIATQRTSQSIAAGYDGGASGASSVALGENLSGGGIQMKVGVQFAPMEAVRLGVMVATPSYLAFVNQDTTSTQTVAPPDSPPSFTGSQTDELSGAWAGVEPGLTRVGLAWLRERGWIETDLIVHFPLETPVFGIDWKTVANVRVGGIARVSRRLKIGGGFSTDFSAQRALDEFAENAVDFYRFTVGFDFANREKPPERGESGFYLAFAVAATYSYGVGQIVGALLPSTFGTPAFEETPVRATVNEVAVNVAIKLGF